MSNYVVFLISLLFGYLVSFARINALLACKHYGRHRIINGLCAFCALHNLFHAINEILIVAANANKMS